MSSLRNNYALAAAPEPKPIIRRFTDNGLQTGDGDLAKDFSSVQGIYYTQPPPDELWKLQHLNFIVSDAGNSDVQEYGSIPAGTITNGVLFFVERDGVTTNLSDILFKTNSDFIQYSSDFGFFTFGGGERVLKYWEFINEYAQGVTINGATNDKVGVILNDNFDTLSVHSCTAKLSGVPNIV